MARSPVVLQLCATFRNAVSSKLRQNQQGIFFDCLFYAAVSVVFLDICNLVIFCKQLLMFSWSVGFQVLCSGLR